MSAGDVFEGLTCDGGEVDRLGCGDDAQAADGWQVFRDGSRRVQFNVKFVPVRDAVVDAFCGLEKDKRGVGGGEERGGGGEGCGLHCGDVRRVM